MSSNILLVTATFNTSLFSTPLTVLNDTRIRISQDFNTLKFIILQTNVDIIILCENTGFKVDLEHIYRLAEERKKKIIFIQFEGNISAINKYGKGFGEGEIIKYAIENSIFLQSNEQSFYKLTGRIYIENINKILKNTHNEICFVRPSLLAKKQADTRFFKCNVGFYKKKLINAYLHVDDKDNFFLEKAFFNSLMNEKISNFCEYPKYIGQSGSTGEKYDLTLFKYNLYKIYNKLGMLNL